MCAFHNTPFYNNGRLLTIYFHNAFFLFDTVVICLAILLHLEEEEAELVTALKSQSDEISCSKKSLREIVDPVTSLNNTQAFIAAKSKQLKNTAIGQRRVADFAV